MIGDRNPVAKVDGGRHSLMVSARTRQNNVSFGVVVALCLQITKVLPIFVSMAEDLDLLVLGHRIRFARRQKGATLADVSELVGRPVRTFPNLRTARSNRNSGYCKNSPTPSAPRRRRCSMTRHRTGGPISRSS